MFNSLINQLGSWPYLLTTLLIAEFLTMLSFLTSAYYWGRMVRKEPANSLGRAATGFGLTYGGLAIGGSGFLSWALAGGRTDGISLAGVAAFTLLIAIVPCFIYYLPFRLIKIPFIRPVAHLLYALTAAMSYWLLFSLNGNSGQYSVEFLAAMWACHLYVANSWEAHGWSFVENTPADKGWIAWVKSFTGEHRKSFIGMFWMWHFYFVVGGLIATHFALSFVSDPAQLPEPVRLYLEAISSVGLFSATLLTLLALSLMLLSAHTETVRGTREVRNRALAGRAILVTTVDEQQKTIEKQVAKLIDSEKKRLREQQSRILMSEMHDGIGGALVSLQLMLNHSNPDWQKARSQVGRCIGELRHTIVAIDPDHGQVAELLAQLRSEYSSLLERAGIRLVWVMEDALESIDLPPANRLHMARIIQEAMTNIIKHANATQVDVAANVMQNSTLEIVVVDNGKGPSATPVTGSVNGTGTGLKSMRRRAEVAGFHLETGPRQTGSGFEVRLAIPFDDMTTVNSARRAQNSAA